MRKRASTNSSTISHVVRGLVKHGRIANFPLTTVVPGRNGVSRTSRMRDRSGGGGSGRQQVIRDGGEDLN